MNSKEAIIEKILNDANEIAAKNIADAEAKAKDLVDKTTLEVDAKKAKCQEGLEDLKKTLIDRRITVANLDAKKTLLTYKSKLIDDIFSKSIEAVTKDKHYKDMLINMLNTYAEDGDMVMINERDKSIITKAIVDKVAKEKDIKLGIASEYGKFLGGIMLVGKNVDKNLTVDSELRAMREDIEQEVATILFGE